MTNQSCWPKLDWKLQLHAPFFGFILDTVNRFSLTVTSESLMLSSTYPS